MQQDHLDQALAFFQAGLRPKIDVTTGEVSLAKTRLALIKSRYDLRTSLDDVQQTKERGWDTYYTSGASLKLREVVLTSSVTSGEHGMPNRSRWAFSAGVSF